MPGGDSSAMISIDKVCNNSLKRFLVELKEQFQSRGDSRGLYLAPETTFVAANAVHDPCHVPEVLFELSLNDL